MSLCELVILGVPDSSKCECWLLKLVVCWVSAGCCIATVDGVDNALAVTKSFKKVNLSSIHM